MSKPGLLQMSGVVVDLVYEVKCMPSPGEEADVRRSLISAGGGYNAMAAAKRAGIKVTYGGAHGTGLMADLVRKALQEESIPCLQARSNLADQGSCVVLVDENGERTFITKHGAEGLLNGVQLPSLGPDDQDWVLVSGYGLAQEGSCAALCAWLAGLPAETRVLFDPSPVISRVPKDALECALSRATWVSANAEEAAYLTGTDSPSRAAEALAASRSNAAGGAILRRGPEGCWLAPDGRAAVHIEGFPTRPIDTTGAGDAHVGTFIAGLCKGQEPGEAAKLANAAAAISTTRLGPAGAPKDGEAQDLLKRQGGLASNA